MKRAILLLVIVAVCVFGPAAYGFDDIRDVDRMGDSVTTGMMILSLNASTALDCNASSTFDLLTTPSTSLVFGTTAVSLASGRTVLRVMVFNESSAFGGPSVLGLLPRKTPAWPDMHNTRATTGWAVQDGDYIFISTSWRYLHVMPIMGTTRFQIRRVR